jgi:hypothetical protein
MDKHLKTHGITKNYHFARIHGYSDAIDGGDYTELDGWSGLANAASKTHC